MRRDTDIVVVGGGPAGLAAAIAARQYGLDVVLADRALPPIDKSCGEGLMPDGIAALGELGITLDTDLGAPFRGIRFIDGDLQAEADFSAGPGLGVRRVRLQQLLIDRATALGVSMCWQSPIERSSAHKVTIAGRHVSCRWIVAADGMQSRLRRDAGIASVWQGERRLGLRRHFRVRRWTDLVEVYWQAGRQAYVTPVAADQICVAIIGERPMQFDNLSELFPDLAMRLRQSEPADDVRGAISQSIKWRRVTEDNMALIGDASGSVDSISGEGMALSFRQALALAPALARQELAAYEQAHRRMAILPRSMARLLLLMARQSRLRHGTLRLLSAQPWLFRRMLALHVGKGPSPAQRPHELPVAAAQ